MVTVKFNLSERYFEPRGKQITVEGTFKVNAENEKHAVTRLSCDTGHIYIQPFLDKYKDEYTSVEFQWDTAKVKLI